MMTKPLIGRWDVDESLLNFVKPDTAVLANETHEGPVFKFPAGVPQAGSVAAVFHGFDVCKMRGDNRHRPRVKIELRVKPSHHESSFRLRLGDESEAAPYRRFWIDEGLCLYVDDGNPHATCEQCGKRVAVSGHECIPILPPMPEPDMAYFLSADAE